MELAQSLQSSVHVDVDMIQFAHAVLKWGGFIHIRSANNKNKRSTFGLFDGEEVHENIVFEGMDVRRVYVALHKGNHYVFFLNFVLFKLHVNKY